MADGKPNETADQNRLPVTDDGPLPEGQGAPALATFWVSVWLGTAAGGSVFGLVTAGFPGLPFGAIIAAVFAVPVHVTAAIVTWLLGMYRWRVALAGLAGGATGIVATLRPSDSFPLTDSLALATVMAGTIGALGATLAGVLHCRLGGPEWKPSHASGGRGRRITRRDLLVRTAVLAVLLAAWSSLVAGIRILRHNALQQSCEARLKLLWVMLESYQSAHGCLPPAYLTDRQGRPVLSWRVAAGEYIWYNDDFSSELDFSQPWDSPSNAEFLGRLEAEEMFQCPAAGSAGPGTTHYVAVVGPQTAWPGKQPAAMSASKTQILLVEWPQSDIHWAEPRDVSVEEFLDWFRSGPDRSGTNHPGCILYLDTQGEIGELRSDADPQTVRRLLVGQQPLAPYP